MVSGEWCFSLDAIAAARNSRLAPAPLVGVGQRFVIRTPLLAISPPPGLSGWSAGWSARGTNLRSAPTSGAGADTRVLGILVTNPCSAPTSGAGAVVFSERVSNLGPQL